MWYQWPKETVVRIVTSDIFNGDAIGNFNIQIRSYLNSQNIPNKLYAANYDVHAGFEINHYDCFFEEYADSDVVLSHYSIYEERNCRLQDVEIPKAVYFHGITPPKYFDAYDVLTADNCRKGLKQFKCFSGFDYYISNSSYMLDELLTGICDGSMEQKHEMLGRSVICPPFVTMNQWDCEYSSDIELNDYNFSLLYVGRIAPHKSIHELFGVVKSLVEKGNNVLLRIVGACGSQSYCQHLADLLDSEYVTIKEHVKFYGHVSQSQLKKLYETSDIFITMSEHEGFCVPLIEAMRFSLPIIAKGRGAIPETLSGSGMVFYDADFNKLANYIESLADNDTRREVIERQNAVYQKMVKLSDGSIILSVLEKLIQKRYKNV